MEELPQEKIGEKVYHAIVSENQSTFRLTIYEDDQQVFTAPFKEKEWAVNYYNNFLRERRKEESCMP